MREAVESQEPLALRRAAVYEIRIWMKIQHCVSTHTYMSLFNSRGLRRSFRHNWNESFELELSAYSRFTFYTDSNRYKKKIIVPIQSQTFSRLQAF